jgi:Pregnancy-associated plasma protein-A
MADNLTPGPVQVPVTVGMRIFVVTDENGQGPLADNAVLVLDVAIASSIWQQAGVQLKVESVRPWVAPDLLDVTGAETEAVRAHDWDPGQAHVDVYYIESTDKGAGSSPLPEADGPHAIILTDEEEEMPDAADWRAIALAHEFGHYLGLLHTHAGDPSKDATYTDHCDDTDIADPHNVMTQGKRGRSKNPSVIHLTADQIARARGYLFGRWPNLVADTVAAVTA